MADLSPKQTIIALLSEIDDAQEMRSLYEAWKARMDIVKKKAVKSFRKGEKVTFPLRNGTTARGIVVKTNTKTVTVRKATTDEGGEGILQEWMDGDLTFLPSWNVPPTMLTRVDSFDAVEAS